MHFGRFPLVRRLALVLGTAQAFAYAAAPFAEARVEHAPAAAAIEAGHSADCVKLHRPDTCVFCQLGSMRARHAECARLPAAGRILAAGHSAPSTVQPARVAHHRSHSRAPPASLV